MIWRDGYNDWVEADKVPELAAFFAKPPPLKNPPSASVHAVTESWWERNVENIWKWLLAPILFGLISFAVHYAPQMAQNSKPGLTGNARSSFVENFVASCVKKQNENPENDGVSASVISQFCNCTAKGMADALSINELKAGRTESEIIALMQPKVEAVGKPCREALEK
jgi:hypothetical protein